VSTHEPYILFWFFFLRTILLPTVIYVISFLLKKPSISKHMEQNLIEIKYIVKNMMKISNINMSLEWIQLLFNASCNSKIQKIWGQSIYLPPPFHIKTSSKVHPKFWASIYSFNHFSFNCTLRKTFFTSRYSCAYGITITLCQRLTVFLIYCHIWMHVIFK
jgi:hypothetical protein